MFVDGGWKGAWGSGFESGGDFGDLRGECLVSLDGFESRESEEKKCAI